MAGMTTVKVKEEPRMDNSQPSHRLTVDQHKEDNFDEVKACPEVELPPSNIESCCQEELSAESSLTPDLSSTGANVRSVSSFQFQPSPVPVLCVKNTAMENICGLLCKPISQAGFSENLLEKITGGVIRPTMEGIASHRLLINYSATRRANLIDTNFVKVKPVKLMSSGQSKRGGSQLDITKTERSCEHIRGQSGEEEGCVDIKTERSDEDMPGQSEQSTSHKDEGTANSNKVNEDQYGGSYAKEFGVLMRQFRTQPRRTEAGCREEQDHCAQTQTMAVNDIHVCHLCNVAFTSNQQLGIHVEGTHKQNQLHMREHTGEKSFKCKECGQIFRRKGNLQRHMLTHTGEKPFKCDLCGKTFGRSSHLQKHIMITHVGDEPYQCTKCGKTFGNSTQLYSHIREGKKSFKCKDCGKIFGCRSGLRIHTRKHTGEKPFKCKECGKTFGYMCSLQNHMKIHAGEKPFKCSECGKTFGRGWHLHRHMRTHTGEKLYQCDECGKTFSNSTQLRCHIRTHTGEKPCRCKHCGKTYRHSSQLHSHMKTHKKEKPS